tara:strand:+ start:198 stop:1166 length:969 start_codon:yes stop_codon:yes gene_type:complete
MEKHTMFVGIDVSKCWLDIAVFTPEDGTVESFKINNEADVVRDFIKALPGKGRKALYCLESTGRYGETFLEVSAVLKLDTWVEHPLQLKNSMGMTRGKSDRVDAQRIADYAYRHRDRAKLWVPESESLAKLRKLQSQRTMFVKVQTQLGQCMEGVKKPDPNVNRLLKAAAASIAAVDAEIEKVIKSDLRLKRQFELVQTVPGVGKVTAVALLLTTGGFTRMTDVRKLACYAGIAPFPYSSGSSIKRRTKVSKMGNMRLKVLFNLSAWNSIRSVPSLKAYYERKVAEGKHKMSAINAVRNKLLAIILAVIRRDEPFAVEYSVK